MTKSTHMWNPIRHDPVTMRPKPIGQNDMLVYADATARDAALPSPVKGMVVGQEDRDSVLTYINGKWRDLRPTLLNIWAFGDVQPTDASEWTRFDDVLTDVDGNLIFEKALVVGDVVADGETSGDFDTVLEKLETLANIRSDYFYIAGNHDYQNDGTLDNYGTKVGEKEKNYAVLFGNALCIFLSDDDERTSPGAVSDQTFNWWKSLVVNNQDKNIVVVAHFPLQDTTSGSDTDYMERSARFTTVLAAYDIDMWIHGHVAPTGGSLAQSNYIKQVTHGSKTVWHMNVGLHLPYSQIDSNTDVCSRLLTLQNGSATCTVQLRNHTQGIFDGTYETNITMKHTVSIPSSVTPDVDGRAMDTAFEASDPLYNDRAADITIRGGLAYRSAAQIGRYQQSVVTKAHVQSQDVPHVAGGTLNHLASDDQGAYARRVWGDGRYIYLANHLGGLLVYRVSEAGGLTYIGGDSPGADQALDVWGDGQYIYLSHGGDGLFVYTADDEGALTQVGALDPSGGATTGIYHDGRFLYVAQGTTGLRVYTVDDSGNPVIVDTDDQGGVAENVWGDGQFIYLANGSAGLQVYSVDNEGTLTATGSHNTVDDAVDVHGDGRFVYVADRTGGVYVYSISATGVPSVADSADPGYDIRGVFHDGRYLFLCCDTDGLHVYDVDDSGTLTHVGSDDQGDQSLGVWSDGYYVYLAESDGGIHVYSVNDAYSYDKAGKTHIFGVGGVANTPDEITATDAGVAASLDTVCTEVTTNGDSDLDSVTLANGTSGQIKHIYCVAEGAGADTWKITPANMVGGSNIEFTGAGEGCTLVYADNEGWIVIANNGGTIS